MRQVVPLTNDASLTFRTSLAEQNVRVTTWWQPFDERWYISIAWQDGRPIVAGLRLAGGVIPLRARAGFVGDLSVEGDGDPGRDAWGDTHQLVHVS